MFPEHNFVLCSDPQSFESEFYRATAPDVVLSIGWSWLFKKDVTDRCWVVGVHPSDLPDFAGGSPIQNQILNGIEDTKNTLFRITSELDGGPIIGQIPLSLSGHIDQIFNRLVWTGIVLLSDFIRDYPDKLNLKPQKKTGDHVVYKRLKENSGRLLPEDFLNKTTKELYDIIRCREAPYPNAYLEDDGGVLYFQMCEWKEK